MGLTGQRASRAPTVDFSRNIYTVVCVRQRDDQHKVLREFLHEIRTPLAVLLYAAKETNELKTVEHIRDLCARYERVITDSYEVTCGPINVQEITTEVAAMVDGSYETMAEKVLVKVPEVYVSADPLLLRQILLNILTNARNHGGGTIEIRAARESDDCVLVQVANSTVPRKNGGSEARNNYGVGLPLASELAAAMGGHVRVLPDEHLWSVELRLPAHK